MTAKLDLYKLHKAEYVAPNRPVLRKTKPAPYLAIDGQGEPGGERFTACIGALYGMAFTIKMTRKFAGKQDYEVCKLEGQRFFDGDPSATPKDEWKWKLMIRTPGFISLKELKAAATTLLKRGKSREVEEVNSKLLRKVFAFRSSMSVPMNARMNASPLCATSLMPTA